MAGKIIADTLEHSTAGSVTTDYVVNGSAKMWVNLRGNTSALRDSFNVSSLTDSATGDFTFNFSSSLSNSNYASSLLASGGDSSYMREAQHVTAATGSFRTKTKYWSGISTANADDSLYITMKVHGDLA